MILTDAELARLLERAAARSMLYFYLVLLAETGLRAKTEALHLRWADIDLDAGFLRVKSGKRHRGEYQTKTRRARSVPMTAALVRAYRDHAAPYRLSASGNSECLFHYERERRGHAAGERIASLDGGARRVIRDAKVSAGFRLHDLRHLRHLRLTTWLAEGMSPVHVPDAVGHALLATTMKYTHLLPTHLRPLVEDPAEEGPTGAPNEFGGPGRARSAHNVAQSRAPRAG